MLRYKMEIEYLISLKEREHLYWYLCNSEESKTGTYNTESQTAITKIIGLLKKIDTPLTIEAA